MDVKCIFQMIYFLSLSVVTLSAGWPGLDFKLIKIKLRIIQEYVSDRPLKSESGRGLELYRKMIIGDTDSV